MVNVDKIEFSYGKKNIFENFSLKVNKGEFFGIIGPNGSGKSTLLKILLGIFRVKSGTVRINGRNIENITRTEAARQASAVMQEFSPAFDFTVKEIIQMGRTPHLKLFGELKSADHEIINCAVRDADLTGYENRNFKTLSGGEKQRVLIAKCFAQSTPLILLDEFVAHLDLGHVQSLMEQVYKKNRKDGTTVVGVFHDVNTASMYCDRIAILKKGSIYEMGEPKEIINESIIKSTYEASCSVIGHPLTGTPQVILNR